MQVSRGAAGLQAWTILAPQLPWQQLADLPVAEVQSSILPALLRLGDEVSIEASQAPEEASDACLRLMQVRSCASPALRDETAKAV